MFIAYVDESGYTGNSFVESQPVLCLACVLVNVYSLHKTRSEFSENIDILRKNNIPLKELKAREIYSGEGPWEKVDGEIRHGIFNNYFNWLNERGHKVLLSIIDNRKFFDLVKLNDKIAKIFNWPYIASAIHAALGIQKINFHIKENKGKTILIFDRQKDKENVIQDFLFNPPKILFEYFTERDDENLFSVIIDTAYFVNSDYAYFIQVADTVAYVIRKYFELEHYGCSEGYRGEKERIRKWVDLIRRNLVSKNIMYKNGPANICKFYYALNPCLPLIYT